jgi:hypothetical protein
MVFSSCYEPAAAFRGIITKADKREILEIDGRAASAVYRDWLKNAQTAPEISSSENVEDKLKIQQLVSLMMQEDATVIGDKLFSISTLRPLGRRGAKDVQSLHAQDDFYQLMHPHSITERGGIRLFAEVKAGHEVTLMTSSSSDLVDLVTAATDGPDVSAFCESLQGALVVYCAGCSLQVGSEISNVGKNLSTALRGQPFMGTLSYGEQGVDSTGCLRHGNLMYSLLLFGSAKQQEEREGAAAGFHRTVVQARAVKRAAARFKALKHGALLR